MTGRGEARHPAKTPRCKECHRVHAPGSPSAIACRNAAVKRRWKLHSSNQRDTIDLSDQPDEQDKP